MDMKTLVINFLLTFVAAFLAVSLFAALHTPPRMPMPQLPSQQIGPQMPPPPPMAGQPQMGGPQMIAPPKNGQPMPPREVK